MDFTIQLIEKSITPFLSPAHYRRIKLRFPAIFYIILCFASCSPRNEAGFKSLTGSDISKEKFDSYLESKMEELNIPGLSIAILNEGKVVHHRTIGYANLEKKIPVTNKTLFEGASISKSVFAFFVMNYVEEGKLDLDKPLYEYLPYPDIEYDERYQKITARMALSHRTGFPNWRNDEGENQLKIHFEPGTGYEYSGEGFQYLAMVLKHLEGTGWEGLEAAFQKKVAQPLGMEQTVFIQTPYTRAHKAEPYDEKGQRIDWENSNWYKERKNEFGAAYSIQSEPIDFSRWMVAVMNKELLSEESYNELFKPHSPVSSGLLNVTYTLGFMNPKFPFFDTDIYLHSGNNDGFTCWYALDIKKGWGFVVFTNSEFGDDLGEELFFYLLLGSFTKFYIIGGLIALIILLGIGYFIRLVIRKIKGKKKATLGYMFL